jgi:hypothetical protein
MRLLEDRNRFVNLHEELRVVPPRVAADTWINDAACILHNITLFIADTEASVFFLDEVRYVDEPPAPFPLELLLTILNPI